MSIDYRDVQQINAHLEALGAIFAKTENVHQHTKVIGEYAQKFRAFDEKHKLSVNAQSDFEVVYQEIVGFSQNDEKVKSVLNTIKNAGARIENETKLNVQDLLGRTWFLANHQDAFPNTKETVVDNLRHNLLASGGCLAGISARLVQPYSLLVQRMIESQLQGDDEEDIALAKALSLSLELQPGKEKDENETHQALELLQNYNQPKNNASSTFSDADWEEAQVKEVLEYSRLVC